MKKYSIIIYITFSILKISLSQQINYPLNFDFNIRINSEINKQDSIFHSGFKPLNRSYVEQYIDSDSLIYQKGYNDLIISKMPVKWFWRKLLDEDFIVIEEKNLKLYFNILNDYHKGKLKENDTTIFSQNTRGVQVKGELGNKITFYTDFYENQAFFIPYIDEKIEKSRVVPGQGHWKIFKATGRDFASASGYISFSPFKKLNVQLGHGKHFIGEGTRSLLLSDNAFNYPYIKFEFSHKNFQYVSMFTEFNDFYGEFYTYHYKKHGTFNYLSYSPHKLINIALFEGIMWKTSDDSTYVKQFPINYFNPIILSRLPSYNLDNENNMLLGLNLKIKPLKYIQIFAQGVLDDISFSNLQKEKGSLENKFGYQVGIKFFDLFFGNLNKQSLYFHLEYNSVRPYTYSTTNVRQSYSHYNQELAHPLGAGFNEKILIFRYEAYNFYLNYKINSAVSSCDTVGSNFGSNIFLSNKTASFGENSYGNKIEQGVKTNILNQDFTVGYILNHQTFLQIFGNIKIRNYKNSITENNIFYITFGFKTSLNNYYYDF